PSPPAPTPCPYTTLFRSIAAAGGGADAARTGAGADIDRRRRRPGVEAAQHVIQIDRFVRQLVAPRVGPERVAEQRKRNVAGDVRSEEHTSQLQSLPNTLS